MPKVNFDFIRVFSLFQCKQQDGFKFVLFVSILQFILFLPEINESKKEEKCAHVKYYRKFIVICIILFYVYFFGAI